MSTLPKIYRYLIACSISFCSMALHAEEPHEISLESTLVGDGNMQPATTYIVTWDKSPSPDFLKWDPEQKFSDDTLTVIDRKELNRSADFYKSTMMESIK